MSVMDGVEFVLELRKNPDYAAIPVVVVTAKDLTEQERNQLSSAVEQILAKACDPASIPGQIKQAAARATLDRTDYPFSFR